MVRAAIAPDAGGRLRAGARPLELAVIVPTLNERDNVPLLLAGLEVALAGIGWEAIFVDDNSADGTADLLRAFGRVDPRIRVIQRVGRRGLASAVVEGMLASAAPVFAVIDADRQHDETLLPALLAAVRSGARDLAVGSRYMAGGGTGEWSGGREAASRSAGALARFLTGAALTDPMSGFFVIRREAAMAALPRLSDGGFKLLLDLLLSSPVPLRTVELPYTFRTRQAGLSKLDGAVIADYARLLVDKTLGRLVPTRLVLFCAVGTLGVGVHLLVLGALLAAGAPFPVAQAGAVWGAMTGNFALNNAVTYADRRLRGRRLLVGLLQFYAVCLVGAVANVGVGASLHGAEGRWWLAGLAGAAVGAVWNYAASSVTTWRR